MIFQLFLLTYFAHSVCVQDSDCDENTNCYAWTGECYQDGLLGATYSAITSCTSNTDCTSVQRCMTSIQKCVPKNVLEVAQPCVNGVCTESGFDCYLNQYCIPQDLKSSVEGANLPGVSWMYSPSASPTEEITCSSDRDCPAGSHCYTGNNVNKCMLYGALGGTMNSCTDNNDCADNEYCYAENGAKACVQKGDLGAEKAISCSTDNDCSEDEHCYTSHGNMVKECVANDALGGIAPVPESNSDGGGKVNGAMWAAFGIIFLLLTCAIGFAIYTRVRQKHEINQQSIIPNEDIKYRDLDSYLITDAI